ncbi:glycosyltransferase [Flavobacterium wongokense]|uniref:glycosyltransferase n=1 Tax=Flavobacterium wongokense TaxID=2910674 RepID=UPI001F1ABEBE|nr:glycosyltransferase [Flavobacterium sp. WG47]MCF6131963.1 glycosyltransferase [Flavobacterium sp. WG47]
MANNLVERKGKTLLLNKSGIKTKPTKTLLFKTDKNGGIAKMVKSPKPLPEILFITSYPNRECGIATYTQDLIHAIKNKFGHTYALKVCALEEKDREYKYPEEVKYVLQTSDLMRYYAMAQKINDDKKVNLVVVEHEFGLFGGEYGDYYIKLLSLIKKPVITSFHTVLPNPDEKRKNDVKTISDLSASVIVMTETSKSLLEKDYNVPSDKVQVIQHGTHLVKSGGPSLKNDKYHFGDRFVFSTFGLLNSGKCIETALDALPTIINKFPNVLYLIIGKTHPTVKANEGEKYRNFLEDKVVSLGLQGHVKFIDKYLDLEDLLAYLQRTNIYLFTSKDPFQAVSGTFSYAMACGCPIISTPIPHATEMLKDGAGLIVDFENPTQLAQAVIKLLYDPILLEQMSLNGLHKIAPTAWENSAIAHVELINKHLKNNAKKIHYELPEISLEHIKRLTTETGMIQFSKIGVPDLSSGFTLDDNARALIAVAKHYQMTGDEADLRLIDIYLDFIIFCQQEDGTFMNYVDHDGTYFDKNRDENLEDSNGRAIWALGEFCSYDCLFSYANLRRAEIALEIALPNIPNLTSPRAMAFAIKGLYHYNIKNNDSAIQNLITSLADNLVSKFRGVSDSNWRWFEDYLTYANSVLPEAMLYAYLATGNTVFEKTAIMSFDFLLSLIYKNKQIKVISNQGWHNKGKISHTFGEQPIDVAYTIMSLGLFYDTFGDKSYLKKMINAFNWYLGKNHLNKIIYNPCTGGCFDGLEEHHVNLNQGAESTVSYLMARLHVEKYNSKNQIIYMPLESMMNYPETMANEFTY